MNAKLMSAKAKHKNLELFYKQHLVVKFDNAFTKSASSYSPDGPMLEFEVVGDMNNFIDLQKFLPEFECKFSRTNDADLRTGTYEAKTYLPYFSNNALHSLFSECTGSANGVKLSNTNCIHAQKAFI